MKPTDKELEAMKTVMNYATHGLALGIRTDKDKLIASTAALRLANLMMVLCSEFGGSALLITNRILLAVALQHELSKQGIEDVMIQTMRKIKAEKLSKN